MKVKLLKAIPAGRGKSWYGRASKGLIQVNPSLKGENLLITVAHELVHQLQDCSNLEVNYFSRWEAEHNKVVEMWKAAFLQSYQNQIARNGYDHVVMRESMAVGCSMRLKKSPLLMELVNTLLVEEEIELSKDLLWEILDQCYPSVVHRTKLSARPVCRV